MWLLAQQFPCPPIYWEEACGQCQRVDNHLAQGEAARRGLSQISINAYDRTNATLPALHSPLEEAEALYAQWRDF
jgi:hypothetical protein